MKRGREEREEDMGLFFRVESNVGEAVLFIIIVASEILVKEGQRRDSHCIPPSMYTLNYSYNTVCIVVHIVRTPSIQDYTTLHHTTLHTYEYIPGVEWRW